eukprot:Gb_36429 [translate_table: standard]
MLPSLCWNFNRHYDWATEMLMECGGTSVFKGLWMTSLYAVVTCDPANVEYILKTNFTNFPKGNYFRNMFVDIFGDAMFTTDDERWARQRKCGSILLNAGNFRKYSMEWLDHLVYGRLLPILQEANTGPVDFQDVLLRFTFDNMCKTSMGIDPGCLSPDLPDVPFAKAFNEATEACLYRFVMPQYLWQVMRYLGIGMERKLAEALTVVDEFVLDVIAGRKRELMRCHGGNIGHWDMLSGFMQLKDDNGCLYPEKAARDFILSFILAGWHTTPLALSWFFWLLHHHPEEMKYLHASLSEAMRLYPPVPINFKESIHDDVLPNGTPVSKGSKIMYFIYSTGRMENVWGKDCCDFKPQRWLKDGVFVSEPSCKYAVFNPGPRLCLGKDLAYTQMKTVAAALIWRFHVRVVSGHPVVPRLALTLFMKHGLLVTLHRRTSPRQPAQACLSDLTRST